MLTAQMSPQRRDEILDALRRGTVPSHSLDAFAVGLDRFEATLDEELHKVSAGGSMFKAVRGKYGCGKTFLARWLTDRARKMGFATFQSVYPMILHWICCGLGYLIFRLGSGS
jgi:hypothetical protein